MRIEFRITKEGDAYRVESRSPEGERGLTDGWSHMNTVRGDFGLGRSIGDEFSYRAGIEQS